jgi:hypothetical protein
MTAGLWSNLQDELQGDCVMLRLRLRDLLLLLLLQDCPQA